MKWIRVILKRDVCLESFWSCDMLCVSQGMLIDCLGRKVLIMGGYTLMAICCVLFTLTLTFQVIIVKPRNLFKKRYLRV